MQIPNQKVYMKLVIWDLTFDIYFVSWNLVFCNQEL